MSLPAASKRSIAQGWKSITDTLETPRLMFFLSTR